MTRLMLFVSCLMLYSECRVSAADAVQASSSVETAWTGQPVPFNVTLFSPGPFAGTAAFDLPKLPQTVILKTGSPVVGSEQIDGETLFTQRHEFVIYTQRSGIIVVPSFEVQFSGKRSFTGDAEPMSGSTDAFQFESKRPPGTENEGFVVTADSIESTQQWNPATLSGTRPGDVVIRTIKRTAEGTTAMMLPPLSNETPDGVNGYLGKPVVEDQVSRGDSTAIREDTIKYQFQRSGTYTLPDIQLVWWDPKEETIRTEILAGQTVSVEALEPTDSAAVDSDSDSDSEVGAADFGLLRTTVGFFAIAASLSILFILWTRYQNRHRTPESVAASSVIDACRLNDPQKTYAALLDWSRTANMTSFHQDVVSSEFRNEQSKLTERLYSVENPTAPWDGLSMLNAFRSYRRERMQTRKNRPTHSDLPELNPTTNVSDRQKTST